MSDNPPTPSRIGRFEIRGKVGEGGMATVFLGKEDGGKLVALKVIKDEYAHNAEFVTMFHDEAKLVSRIVHPNVVRVHEIGAVGQRLFIAMEHLEGQSLWNLWEACRARGVRIRYELIAWICARVAEGAHHAHELVDDAGAPLAIVHRDLNASNIILGYDGRVTVIDFGLAKTLDRGAKTAAGIVKGKLAYLSPEQIEGKAIDRRSDVFTLGVTLWETSCDRRLFKGEDDMATVRKVHETLVPDPLTIVAGYPAALAMIVKRCLARDPAERFATASELGHALDAFIRVEGRGAGPEALAELVQQIFGRERLAEESWVSSATAEPPGAPAGAPMLPTLRPNRGGTAPMPTLPPPAPIPRILPIGTQPRATTAPANGMSSHPPPFFNPPPSRAHATTQGSNAVPPRGRSLGLVVVVMVALACIGAFVVFWLRSH